VGVVAHRPSLYRLAGLVATDRAAAQDLVQNTFVRAWRSWDRISGSRVPEAYVRRILVNLARSGWRRQGRRERLAGGEGTVTRRFVPFAGVPPLLPGGRCPVTPGGASNTPDVVGQRYGRGPVWMVPGDRGAPAQGITTLANDRSTGLVRRRERVIGSTAVPPPLARSGIQQQTGPSPYAARRW
jgi:hypothetical protein